MTPRDLHDGLASAYVLGTLHGHARTRFVQRLRSDAALQAHVAYWEQALLPMGSHLSAVPSPQVWVAIAARVAPRGAATAPRRAGQATREAIGHALAGWFGLRTLTPLVAGLFLGVTLSLTAPGWLAPAPPEQADTQLPESYVGVLAGANGRAGLIVSSRRHGMLLDVKQVQPIAAAAGQTLFLWVIEADATTRAIGPVPPGKFVQVALAGTSEQLFAKATELAVSIEAAGATPAAPAGPFVYRGLCGKLWRVPAPKK